FVGDLLLEERHALLDAPQLAARLSRALLQGRDLAVLDLSRLPQVTRPAGVLLSGAQLVDLTLSAADDLDDLLLLHPLRLGRVALRADLPHLVAQLLKARLGALVTLALQRLLLDLEL